MLGINTNAPSLGAQNNLSKSASSLETSIARLSSGLRVNSAGRVATGTTFNGNNIFEAANKTVDLQIGSGNVASDTLSVNLTDTGAAAGNDLQTTLGGATQAAIVTAFGGVDTVANATTAITEIDTAINDITNLRATTGASLSRLDQVVSSLETTSANLSSARGRIMDADFAKETANLTRSQILQQAGTAMLAQANQLPNNVLSLLR
ncbi:flagellin [Limnobacter sp.]|uniref:flagellin n=1 Tax=Limnobacter sp. TaxID=2003368 RepID=UPI003748D3DC